MIVALIPARSGSRAIKDKNLVLLGGKPLIAWSIQTALACQQIDRVIVSTDSPHYAQIARKYGAEVPFLRPKKLAKDGSHLILTLKDTLERLQKMGIKTKVTVLLQPTSPFRKASDIDQAIMKLKKPKTDAVVSVCKTKENPYFTLAKIKNGYLRYPLLKTPQVLFNRQQAPQLYRINGCLYTFKTKAFLKENTVFPKRTRPLLMPSEISVDIDTPADLLYAKFILKHSKFFVGMKTGTAK